MKKVPIFVVFVFFNSLAYYPKYVHGNWNQLDLFLYVWGFKLLFYQSYNKYNYTLFTVDGLRGERCE